MRVDGAKAFGVDVSQWQGNIDWAAAKADGVEYAIIRCGWGVITLLKMTHFLSECKRVLEQRYQDWNLPLFVWI